LQKSAVVVFIKVVVVLLIYSSISAYPFLRLICASFRGARRLQGKKISI
jgi:hypothetical protein